MSSLRGNVRVELGHGARRAGPGMNLFEPLELPSPPSIVCLIVSLPATNQGARTYERRRSFAHRGMSAMCSRFSIIQAVYNARG